MEGAPNFEEQPSGPFALRERFNEIVRFCRALALADDKGGGKIIYGENKVTFTGGGGNLQFIGDSNGTLVTYNTTGTITGTVPPA